MGIGTSLFLIAVGAILRWAVTDTISWVNLATVGLILLIVGIVGLAISLIWMLVYTRRGTDTVVPPDRYTEAPPRY
jgi:hypothetical protein